jgi:class 3 adenylate cyclase/tetratricopeptide (TPR) repeat protein
MKDIAVWLEEIGLAKHSETFRSHDIDFDVLPALDENELKELGLSLGDRKRLLRAIAELSEAVPETPAQAVPPSTAVPSAERRQLTVLFVDLVDSTALSQQLDAEDLRDVMRGYHEAVARVIRDADGFVAKFMGDGVLAYFGYPQASEDAAERAVRASLQAVAAVKALPPFQGRILATRVGVATGPVVVGDVVGDDIAREINVVGETPNLAARLLGVSRPDTVVIAETTRRLIGDRFTLMALGPQTLKGIAEPVAAFEVTGERHGLSRFEAAGNSLSSHFVGRNQEVGLLLDRWQQAKAGDGQLILLSGEAGIGKSRITETMYRHVAADTHYLIRYQCTPQHINSSLYPAITQLANAAGIQPEDDATARTTRIRSALPDVTEEQVELVANLLGVPFPEGSSSGALAPTRRRQLMLDAFAVQLEALSRQRPVLWIVEDAHWIDPTTEELVSRIVEKSATQRLLIVVTHRPEYLPPWSSDPIATQLVLNRLSRTHARGLLEGLGGGKAVPPEAAEYILARTDGVPLYVEELFRALCDSGALRETATAFELARRLEGTAVPATLQDSLMARLDRLAPAKTVAQLGAAIGREFEYGLLFTIAGMQPQVLSTGLDQLITAGLIFARGTAPEVTYTFKHALVQDAAYGSMLKQRRQVVHANIAQTLASRAQDTRPELLAHHFEIAGQYQEAAKWLEAAGDAAVYAAASREAIRVWKLALKILADETLSRDAQRWLVELQQKLSGVITQVEGYGSVAALEVAETALSQAVRLDDTELYVRTACSMSATLSARLDFDRMEQLLARVSDDELQHLSASVRARFWCTRGSVRFHRGRFVDAGSDLGTIMEINDRTLRHDSTFGGGDVRVTARYYLARANLVFGFQDKADRVAAETLTLAKEIGHPFSIAWALITGGRTNFWGGKYADAVALLDQSIEINDRYGFVGRQGLSLACRGMTVMALGDVSSGVEEFDRGLDLWRRSSGQFAVDLLLVEAADILVQNGCYEVARPYLEEARRHFASGPERSGYAEFFRIDGRLMAVDGDRGAARAKFQEARAIAESQGANRFRLRASRDLARLLAEDGDVEGARNVLEPVYAWFTEGFDAPDIKGAKVLLDELNRR